MQMIERVELNVGGEDLKFETGRIAKQAHGSVLVTMGETIVLSAVCVAPEPRPSQSFLPLTVDYREKGFAAGNIPGNYFRREGRPSEREILVCRLTDRPIRPLFPKGFFNEMIVCQTVFSADNIHDPDILSINAASAALHISKIPWAGPIGAVRVGMIDGELRINPHIENMERSRLDLVIAGTHEAICMVEGAADQVTEDELADALERGHQQIVKICETIDALRNSVGEDKMDFEPPQLDPAVVADVEAIVGDRLAQALNVPEKQKRQKELDNLSDDIERQLTEKYGEELYEERAALIEDHFRELERRAMREQVVRTNRRIDGRPLDEVRPIEIEVGLLGRAHGSCLFTRGETQAVVTTTLGTGRDEQRIDELTGDVFKRFFLHYNFPPWSVGEVRRIMGPGRREIGHGRLAERALLNVLPLDDEDIDFPPYVIRIVSDITESNGSSSMASVCGGSLSLMDAGVPIKHAVAGIAMGMIKEGDEVRILTDILGAEDHMGDMDFKVCGTRNGITAFQMDVKIADLSSEIMRNALDKAKTARMHVLDCMDACLAEPRPDYSPYAPRIFTIQIPVDKIRDVIGPGGKVVNEIQNTTGVQINVEEDGTINVASPTAENAERAIEMIKELTAEVELGKMYHGKVTRIAQFGAFVSLIGKKEGLIRIQDIAPGHIRSVGDVLDIGDEVDVKVIEIDGMGRVNLSKVEADVELGRISREEADEAQKAARNERRSSRDSRDRDRGGSRGGGGRSSSRRGGGRPRGGKDRRR